MSNMVKVARVCWNTNGWKYPSGPLGKSTGKDAYENLERFGHEEWLLDDSRIIDGYHYAYLEPINQGPHKGEQYDIHIFTFTKHEGKVYLGIIRDVHCLTDSEAEFALKEYKKNGWLKEMRSDVENAEGDPKALGKSAIQLFNIRFRFQDYHPSWQRISAKDPNTRALYYKLQDYKGDFIFEGSRPVELKDQAGKKARSTSKGKDKVSEVINSYHSEPKEFSPNPYHKKMQNRIKALLDTDSKYAQVLLEPNHVDIRAERVDGTVDFFEIKTRDIGRFCIREAIGQLLEYAHFPDGVFADRLFIVGPCALSNEEKAYIKFLRDQYNMPVWYMHYSFSKNLLTEE